MARDRNLTTDDAQAAPSPHPQLLRERQEREERLATALRENLKRRKRQTRARTSTDEPDVAEGSATSAGPQEAR